MRWPVGLFWGGILLAAVGCRNNDLVEAELRTRENDVRALRADLAQAELHNEALMRELSAIRHGAPPAFTPELASQTYTLKQISLGRGTGGYDDDNCPGDEALQVVVEPKDCDDHTIKAPGTLHVDALEISQEGLKMPLCSWDVPPPHLRRLWRSGLLSTGYFVVLPWKNWPSSEKIRVVAHFTLADGRVFEAEKDVTIRLTPIAYRKTPPAFPLETPPEPGLPTSDVIPLPAPRKADPETSTPTSRAWWMVPDSKPVTAGPKTKTDSSSVTAAWRPVAEPSIVDSIELLRPTCLRYQPGESP
jgi:hypothetical protein